MYATICMIFYSSERKAGVVIEVPEAMSPVEVAEALKVRPVTVRKWIAGGKLPAFRVGSRLRVRPEDVQRMVDEPAAAAAAGKETAAGVI